MILKKHTYNIILLLIILAITGGCNNIDNASNNQIDVNDVVQEKHKEAKKIINLTHTLDDNQASCILKKIKDDYILPKDGENYVFDWITIEFNNEQFKTDSILIDIYINADMKFKSKQDYEEKSHDGGPGITTFLYRLEIENIINNNKVTDELKYNIYVIGGAGSISDSILSGELNRQTIEKNIKDTSNLDIHFDKSIKSLNVSQAEIIAKDIKDMYIKYFDKNVYKLENFNYEFNSEENEAKRTVDVNVYFDITLIRNPIDNPFILGMKQAISELNDKDKIAIAENIMEGWIQEFMPDYNVTDRNVQYLNLKINENNNSVLEYDLFYPYVLEGETTLYPAKEYYKSIKKTAEELKQSGEEVIRREIQ
ncbi:MAG: hypothetical protein N4A68_13675 [Maledivibacter sp.]|jgi:hypothetical protein|nr:hypothetical protein [Maledivibacter sp.]